MPATAADIALYTTDGTLLTSPTDPAVTAAIKAAHIDARDSGSNEIELPFDTVADGQAMLDERFSYLSQVNPLHLGIEVEEALDLGGTIPIGPTVPSFQVVDGDTSVLCRTRGYAYDMNTERFSVEVLR